MEERRMTTTLPVDRMIDLEHGKISREIFVSPEFYSMELEKLFTRAWLYPVPQRSGRGFRAINTCGPLI
jgi:hypothetical protein